MYVEYRRRWKDEIHQLGISQFLVLQLLVLQPFDEWVSEQEKWKIGWYKLPVWYVSKNSFTKENGNKCGNKDEKKQKKFRVNIGVSELKRN